MNFFNNYEEVSKQFVNQYYQIFDDPNARPNLANFYQVRRLNFDVRSVVFKCLGQMSLDQKFTKAGRACDLTMPPSQPTHYHPHLIVLLSLSSLTVDRTKSR